MISNLHQLQLPKHLYEVWLTSDKCYLLDDVRTWRLRTIVNAPEEDWKTATAKHIPPIPAGEEVIFVKQIFNCYGEFIEVLYNGRHYSVKPEYLEYVGCDPMSR